MGITSGEVLDLERQLVTDVRASRKPDGNSDHCLLKATPSEGPSNATNEGPKGMLLTN